MWVLEAEAVPQPGDVFRDYIWRGSHWRVTDPDAGNPGAHDHLPNPTYRIAIDDLDQAIGASQNGEMRKLLMLL